MKLTPQEIHFIDNYLQKAEVVYVDIRSEMVDHVATAVEVKMNKEHLDFYEAFKQYMVYNKKELLKNKGAWSVYSKTVMVAFLKFTAHPFRLMIGVVLYLFFNFVNVATYFPENFTIQNLFFVILLVVALGQMIYFHFVLSQRFFVLERLGGLLAVLYYLQMFFMNTFSNDEPGVCTLTVLYYFLIAYLWYFTNAIYLFQKRKIYFSK